MLHHVWSLLGCHLLILIKHTTNDFLSLLQQLNKLSAVLGHLVRLIADQLLDLDALVHVGQGVWRTTLVEAGRGVLNVTLEGGLVILADLFVQVQEGLSGCDAFREGSESGVVDHGDNLGDGGGRHLGRAFAGYLCLSCQKGVALWLQVSADSRVSLNMVQRRRVEADGSRVEDPRSDQVDAQGWKGGVVLSCVSRGLENSEDASTHMLLVEKCAVRTTWRGQVLRRRCNGIRYAWKKREGILSGVDDLQRAEVVLACRQQVRMRGEEE